MYKNLLAEAPYIVLQAINTFRELIANNFVLTRSEIPDQYCPQDSRQDYNDVKNFVENCCKFDSSTQVTTDQLYQAYRQFSEEQCMGALSSIAFSRLLSDVIQTLNLPVKSVKRVGPEDRRGYVGIGLTDAN